MFTASNPGPKYAKKKWACQDNSGKKDLAYVKAIAVADGHGSSDCFRSELGSSIAIRAFFNEVEIFCGKECDDPGLSKFSETGINNFKYAVWCEWKKLIKEDWEKRLINQVLGENELRFEFVSEKYKDRFSSEDPDIVERYLYTAYGTTLLCAVVIESQILLIQIGDGTCVMLQKNGEYSTPIPYDEDNFLNVTASLCEEGANRKIRHKVIDCNPDSLTMPVAIFLSTDGIDDCYPVYHNEHYLYRLYSIIIENILAIGFSKTEAEIEGDLLIGMTEKGSQDDISLAYLISENMERLREAYEYINPSFKVAGNLDNHLDVDENSQDEVQE
nr:protein phosphatase 2C domain-containing protein [Enterococcus sp. 669A]